MFSKMMFVTVSCVVLTSCDVVPLRTETTIPADDTKFDREYGEIDGSLKDFFTSERETGDESAFGVNAILWSSAIQTVSFMGVKAVDPSSGTLVTDWYRADTDDKVEYQVTVTILGKTLRSDAVNITTASRDPVTKIGSGSAIQLSQQLKNAILTKAREIRQDRAGGL